METQAVRLVAPSVSGEIISTKDYFALQSARIRNKSENISLMATARENSQ
jgi:hypothetical protein